MPFLTALASDQQIPSRSFRRFSTLSAGCAAIAILSACGTGTTTGSPTPTDNELREGDLSGTVVRDEIIPFSATFISGGSGNEDLSITGEVQDRVVRLDSDGTLVFAPRIRNVTAVLSEWSVIGIEDVTSTGFGLQDVALSYRTDGLGTVQPATFTRSPDGDRITHTFNLNREETTLGAVGPPGSERQPEDMRFMWIETGATEFTTDGTMTINAWSQSFNGRREQVIVLTGMAAPTLPDAP
ncbi:hypothetical protein [Dinoroseobacter sp. S375]|uniref:hypothetical protein n=1 Tax=Dinoroseobacter sp. S375 TaxID=3415136 RepID=UPI003C7C89EC